MTGKRCVAALLALGALQAMQCLAATMPDWTGVWVMTNESMESGAIAEGGVAVDRAAFLAADKWPVPLRPEWRQRWLWSADQPAPGRLPHCQPAGMPGLMQHPMLTEYLVSRGRVTVLFEDGEVRRIYTDGRPHPIAGDLPWGISGHSIGHWEGKALVVDTAGITPGSDIFLNNDIATTDKTHISERIALKDKDHLQIDTVVTDDSLFTRPYTYTRVYGRSGLEMGDPACAQNNRDNDRTLNLTPPP